MRSQKNFARREVVRDVDVGEPEVALEVEHQLEDLRPDAHVEHRDGLVGDQQSGPRMIARAITARCFWPPERSRRVLVDELLGRREADALERLARPAPALSRALGEPWICSGCPTACSSVIAGFSEACGSWKTICICRRSGAQLALGQPGELLALERDAAAGRPHEAEQRPAERRLAAARTRRRGRAPRRGGGRSETPSTALHRARRRGPSRREPKLPRSE